MSNIELSDMLDLLSLTTTDPVAKERIDGARRIVAVSQTFSTVDPNIEAVLNYVAACALHAKQSNDLALLVLSVLSLGTMTDDGK